MSETVANPSPTLGTDAGGTAGSNEFFLDGAAPRLAAAAVVAEPPTLRPQPVEPTAPESPLAAPTLPVVSPVLSPPTASTSSPPTGDDQDDSGDVDRQAEHPMAHLMPAKARPTEASRRAAEQRAIQKAKAKKIKIGVIAGLLVVTAIVGPPLGKWVIDAVNEAGSTDTVQDVGE